MENSQLALPVAIQGFDGSFHQLAVRHFFGDQTPVLFCSTFRDLVKVAADPLRTSAAIMAIENSIAGSILPNYNLLHRSGLEIAGEIYLQINQHLLVCQGTSVTDIKEVHSHPMALQQCLDYLGNYDWRLVETEDTGLSAKQLSQDKSRDKAVIAGRLAAELFDLKVLAKNIHTQKSNYTRFLVLARPQDITAVESANKASVNFQTDHTKGSLARVLNVIAQHGINLSKLQSFPIPDEEWHYAFHADMEFETADAFHSLVKELSGVTKYLKVYGIYQKGETYTD